MLSLFICGILFFVKFLFLDFRDCIFFILRNVLIVLKESLVFKISYYLGEVRMKRFFLNLVRLIDGMSLIYEFIIFDSFFCLRKMDEELKVLVGFCCNIVFFGG